MRKYMMKRILQLIYDLFYGSGGVWPTLADLQRELDRQDYGTVVAARIVQQIDAALLKPISGSNGYPRPTEPLILTAAAIKRCSGSAEDIAHLLTALRWLGRRAEQSDTANDHGMRFTTRQLAEAVPVDLGSDALYRLLAILEAEGWVHDDDAA